MNEKLLENDGNGDAILQSLEEVFARHFPVQTLKCLDQGSSLDEPVSKPSTNLYEAGFSGPGEAEFEILNTDCSDIHTDEHVGEMHERYPTVDLGNFGRRCYSTHSKDGNVWPQILQAVLAVFLERRLERG